MSAIFAGVNLGFYRLSQKNSIRPSNWQASFAKAKFYARLRPNRKNICSVNQAFLALEKLR
jgi:hypothetical protein